MRVLIVEDEKKLATTVATGLRREGMAVDIAFDGRDGLRRATEVGYDVVVLDRDLPEVRGDELCRVLVESGSRSRVLMLTASSRTVDRVEGLNLGADDYLAKPFDFPELVARVRALGRRSQPAQPPVLAQGDICLDTTQRIASRGGQRIDLGRQELAVLELLLAAGGSVLSARELRARAWDAYGGRSSDVVKVTISRLRRKLGDPPVIETIANAGYRLIA
jgi:DNA-binding response OmpR family regulator